MSSEKALSRLTDTRYLAFRARYTTRNELQRLREALGNADAPEVEAEVLPPEDEERWEIEAGFTRLARAKGLPQGVVEPPGFEGLAQQFHWGLARLAHQGELASQVYREIRRGILYPAATAGAEYRERAELALENEWWDDAVQNLRQAIAHNPMDFLAHYHLGHTLWFQFGQWEPALDQFRLAARYADAKRADEGRKYYAALAYAHISLLCRLQADADPEQAQEANRQAFAASRRAVELKPGFMIPRVEHAVNCMRLGLEGDVWTLLAEDAREDKRRLVAYQLCPDLKAFPRFAELLERARETVESVAEEQARLQQEAAQRRQEGREEEQRRIRQARDARLAGLPATCVRVIRAGRAVRALALSPDGSLLASGGEDRLVRLWDPASGRECRSLAGHEAFVSGLAFSPDGELLASAAADGTVRLWDVSTGEEVRALCGHTSRVLAVAFSPDGRRLASGGADRAVAVWDLLTAWQIGLLLGHSHSVLSVSFHPGGQILASAGVDQSVRLWDLEALREVRILTGHRQAVYSVVFSPNGWLVASGSGDCTVRLWDADSGRLYRELVAHEESVGPVVFTPDGRFLASGSDDATIRLWDAATCREVRVLTGHEWFVSSLAFGPDGRMLVSGSGDGTLRIWRPASS